ncbi:MAG: flagellar biosynthesis protein FlgA [Micropruina sp.]|nr:MAG: flagellar biosynthesis protein FlgA [Micropruina sp.]QLQ17080.1 MAG: flagellar biosynthesis protein FlgA [Micropruina sp.]
MLGVSTTARPAPVRARRNVRWIVAGVIAVCLGALGSAYLYVSVAQAHSVVRVNRTIYRGETVTATDLGSVSLGSAVGIETVPVESAADLVGKTALIDLPGGSLIVPGAVGDAVVAPNAARVGLRLAAGRLPVSALPAGTPVLLVPLAKDSQTAPEGASVVAQVATAPTVLVDGSSVLDVSVPAAEAERIARLAAAELVVMVRRAGS